jgi:hypothetical protein
MAEETQQEKESRWATQRTARDTQQRQYEASRARTRTRNWVVAGAILLILVVLIAAKILL